MSTIEMVMNDKEYVQIAKSLIKDGSEDAIELYFKLETMLGIPGPNDNVETFYAVTRMPSHSFGMIGDGYKIVGVEHDLNRVVLLIFNDFYVDVETEKKFAKTADEINLIKEELSSFSSNIDFISRGLDMHFNKKYSAVEHDIRIQIGKDKTIIYRVQPIRVAR